MTDKKEEDFEAEFELEEDGRWIADITAIPGALAYGATPVEAFASAYAIYALMKTEAASATPPPPPDPVQELDENAWRRTTLSGGQPEEGVHGGAPAPIDPETGMHKDYWVLPEEERKKGFTRPYYDVYRHTVCGANTRMGRALSETYARNPQYYGSTFCASCGIHLPVGENGNFYWVDGRGVVTKHKVGT